MERRTYYRSSAELIRDALDDCEQAYSDILKLGINPHNIVLLGDSAGGNLVFGLLQRIAKRNLEMPCCVIPISPVTELSRIHGLPSRAQRRHSDPLLPISAFASLAESYLGGQDTSNPEISPLYMDCTGLPPMQFFVSDNEVLRDDTVYMAKRCHAAGVLTECHLWSTLPHAFPLFGSMFSEVGDAHDEMIAFATKHLTGII
ncbi:alpha/beta hydrolase fold domain-containing protein [Spongiibacter sp. KMU-158]|uniref:Alpha/beta hydrolase fold domain-containing protein n=1 Tax=Spongiibacter pelagi TaxID=2760804 RepID=A0A927C637_9GAMM|nr:alpha/beta hydrolase fold domain-containing protein [Spongiibacter pelagi]MBD2860246.1 alpha/beta hydrolase fold domain-containing protein [Spongiibacter pelagi]